jgi:triacylglycerol lipase
MGPTGRPSTPSPTTVNPPAVAWNSRNELANGESMGLPAFGPILGPPWLASRCGLGVYPSGNPIIFVPGYLDLPCYFDLIWHRLETNGRDVYTLNTFPNIGTLAGSAAKLRQLVAHVRARTGATSVDLVAHSSGGLIARYYIQNLMDSPCVERLVTLATPHHGTFVGYLGPGLGAREMRPGSDLLNALNTPDQAPPGVKVTSIRAGLDEIILPHDSPILAGARNDLVPLAEHASIFVLPQALAFVEAALAR